MITADFGRVGEKWEGMRENSKERAGDNLTLIVRMRDRYVFLLVFVMICISSFLSVCMYVCMYVCMSI